MPSLAVRRMHSLALAFQHGWTDRYPHPWTIPETLEEARAAHKEIQSAVDMPLTAPSFVHKTGSDKTQWVIGMDGTVYVMIKEMGSSKDDQVSVEMKDDPNLRVMLVIYPDGSEELTQAPTANMSHLTRAARVWEAVHHIREEPTAFDGEPEIVHRTSGSL